MHFTTSNIWFQRTSLVFNLVLGWQDRRLGVVCVSRHGFRSGGIQYPRQNWVNLQHWEIFKRRLTRPVHYGEVLVCAGEFWMLPEERREQGGLVLDSHSVSKAEAGIAMMMASPHCSSSLAGGQMGQGRTERGRSR